jgi:hypothetical protein
MGQGNTPDGDVIVAGDGVYKARYWDARRPRRPRRALLAHSMIPSAIFARSGLAARALELMREAGARRLPPAPDSSGFLSSSFADMSEEEYARIEEDALSLLELLCREPSVSAEGRALETTAQLVQEHLAENGFEMKQLRVEGGPPAVYGEQRGRGDFVLLLYNHYDGQPVAPSICGSRLPSGRRFETASCSPGGRRTTRASWQSAWPSSALSASAPKSCQSRSAGSSRARKRWGARIST